MDFDIKLFFKDPPRVKEDVKSHIHTIGEQIVDKSIHHFKCMSVERVVPKHVQLVFFHMSQEPFTRITRNSLCIQHLKIKTLQKVFTRVYQECEKNGMKNGGIDKKIIKYVSAKLAENNIKFNAQAVVQLSACVAEVCGILLNCTATMMGSDKTMTLNHFMQHSCAYCLSNGTKVLNNSLVRFLHYVKQPNPELVNIEDDKKRKLSHVSANNKENTKKRVVYKTQKLEMKNVSFTTNSSCENRPNTPTNCFWEDD